MGFPGEHFFTRMNRPMMRHTDPRAYLGHRTALHIVQPAPIIEPTRTKSAPKTISLEEARRAEAKRILMLGEDGLDEFTSRDFTIHRVVR